MRQLHDVDDGCMRRLLCAQFPQWGGLPIERVRPGGTDHAIFRVGATLAARLPRVEAALGQADKEWHWLPRLAPRLPLAIPVPLARGMPGEGYPWPWSVYGWLDGDPVVHLDDDGIEQLAGFVRALRAVDRTGAPGPGRHNFGRGAPLGRRDPNVRAALAASRGLVDTAAVADVWEVALAAAPWTGAPVWLHGDLRGDNLLGRTGGLSAVVDFGGLAIGDPACDLFGAWDVMDRRGRDLFRAAVGADESTWMRARGWALSIAIIALPYYLERLPNLAEFARRVLGEVLADVRQA